MRAQLQGEKKQDEALAIFRSNAKKFPDYWTSHMGMARVYSAQGDFDNAVKEVKLSLTGAPDSNKAESGRLCEAVAGEGGYQPVGILHAGRRASPWLGRPRRAVCHLTKLRLSMPHKHSSKWSRLFALALISSSMYLQLTRLGRRWLAPCVWPALQPKACWNSGMFESTLSMRKIGMRMRVGGHDHARDFRTHVCAPRVRVRQEEALAVGPAVGAFIVQRLALLLQRGFERVQAQVDAAIVSGIFALGEQAVLLDSGAGVGNFLRVLVGDALAAFVILLAVVGGPPVPQVAVSVELAALIVEAVNDFVSDDHADRADSSRRHLSWDRRMAAAGCQRGS